MFVIFQFLIMVFSPKTRKIAKTLENLVEPFNFALKIKIRMSKFDSSNFSAGKIWQQPKSQIESLWIALKLSRLDLAGEAISNAIQFMYWKRPNFVMKSPICKQITLDFLKKMLKNNNSVLLLTDCSASFSFDFWNQTRLRFEASGSKKNREIKARKHYLTENLSLTNDDIFENSDKKRSKVRSRLLLIPDSTWSGVSLFENGNINLQN